MKKHWFKFVMSVLCLLFCYFAFIANEGRGQSYSAAAAASAAAFSTINNSPTKQNVIDENSGIDNQKVVVAKCASYTVTFESNIDNHIREVNRLLEQGYQTVGGISMTTTGNGYMIFFSQAMVKYSN